MRLAANLADMTEGTYEHPQTPGAGQCKLLPALATGCHFSLLSIQPAWVRKTLEN